MTKNAAVRRVAMVAASLDILGGQGVQAAALTRALESDGVRVDFIPINPRFPAGLGWARRCPYARTALSQALFLPRLARIARADAVHVFSASYWSFLLHPVPTMIAARALGRRVVLHYHSGEAEDHLERWGALVHPWLRLADAIVVPSDYLRRVFERHGHRARVIPNIVDASRFVYRDRVPLRPRLLSVRNLEPHYRVEDTLHAFALVRRQRPGATLTIAGYGSEEPRLRKLAAHAGLEGVRFAGRIEPGAVAALYDDADLFVNSSVVDNQPVSILEAFAAGLPVVSTATGDIPAMVRHGKTGMLVPPGEPVRTADAVNALLSHPARALRLARNARREVERYAWGRVRAEWSKVLFGAAA
jgi:glycosyltransferase involved in cell wall biosynthesis